jgi:hypothetical protein
VRADLRVPVRRVDHVRAGVRVPVSRGDRVRAGVKVPVRSVCIKCEREGEVFLLFCF